MSEKIQRGDAETRSEHITGINRMHRMEVPAGVAVELRKWAFEKAIVCADGDDTIVADLIYQAAEIEAYIKEGRNLRGEFYSCVETALNEIDNGKVMEVSEASKRKTMECVRKWLKEYHALD